MYIQSGLFLKTYIYKVAEFRKSTTRKQKKRSYFSRKKYREYFIDLINLDVLNATGELLQYD
jgi:hypothetical protein